MTMSRSTSRRRLTVAAFATCLTLVAGACGSNDEAAPSIAPTSGAPTTASATATTVAPTTVPATTVPSQANCNTWTIWRLISDPQFKFTTFARMVEAAGLVDLLDGPGPIAVFNVQDEYFTQWSTITGTPIEELFADKELLRKIISHHIVTEDITTETITPEYMPSAKFREYKSLEGSNISLLTVQRVPMAYNINPNYPGGFTRVNASACYSNGFFLYMSWPLWPPDVEFAPFERCPDQPCGCRPADDPGNVFYCQLMRQYEVGLVDPMRVAPGLTDLPPECAPVRILQREPGTENCTFTELELAVAEGIANSIANTSTP